MKKKFPKIRSHVELYDLLPENERIITDVLRHIIKENLPAYCNEKISYNVPFFYGNKGICIIWPATVPGGGVKMFQEEELKKEYYWVFGMVVNSLIRPNILHMEPINRSIIRYLICRKRLTALLSGNF
jgi:hypothetical protein